MPGLASFGGGIVGGATVRLLLDDTQYRTELDRAKAQTAESSAAMGSSVSKFSAASKAAFAVGGLAAAEFAKVSIEAYLHHEQVLAQLQQTISNTPALAGATTKAFEEQAAALQQLTAYTQDEILSADNILARFKLTKDQINQAIPVVLDYARATGTAVPDAAQNIGKALLGNTRALKTVGISFTATGNTAQDFASIMDLLKAKVGGAAEAFAGTTAGKIEKFKADLHEAEIQIGAALVPVLGALVVALKPLIPILEAVASNVGPLAAAFLAFKAANFLPGLFASIGTAIADLVIGTGALTISTEGLATAEAGLAVEAPVAADAVAAANLEMEATNPIALAAAAGVLVLVKTYQAFKDPSTVLTATFDKGSAGGRSFALVMAQIDAGMKSGLLKTVPEATTAQQKQNLQWQLAAVALTEAGGRGDQLTNTMGGLTSATDDAAASQAHARQVIADAARALGTQSRSLQDVSSAWKGWRDSAAANLSFVQGALGDFAGKAHVSIGKVIEDFQHNRREMNQFGTDLESIRQRGGRAADGLVQSLLNMGDQGVGVAHAIASANESQFGKVIGIWNQTQNKASSFANQLASAIIGPMDRIGAAFLVAAGKAPSIAAGLLIVEGRAASASQAVAILQQHIDGLHSKTVDIGVNVHYNVTGSGAPGGKPLP